MALSSERFLLDGLGKERFPQLLEIDAKMARIEVFSKHCMSNYFHLLIDLLNASESRAQMDKEEILRRLGLVMNKEPLTSERPILERLNEQAPTMVTWSNERFKSMLLEYDKAVLFTMTVYINLNSVRPRLLAQEWTIGWTSPSGRTMASAF